MTMSVEEIKVFLNRIDPPLLGAIGTIDARGYPSTIPVWYRYDADLKVVNIWTTMARAWPKHIQNNPKVSFAVMETEAPFAAVLLKGEATLIANGEDHWDEVRRITERYIAPADVDSYIAPWASLETMCVIHPHRFISWARGY